MNLFTLPQSLQPSAGNCDVTIWVKYSRMGHPKAIYNRSINQINVGALCRHLFKSSYSVLVNFVLVSFFFIFYVRRLGSHQYTHPIFHQNFRYDLFFLNRLSFGKAKKPILLKIRFEYFAFSLYRVFMATTIQTLDFKTFRRNIRYDCSGVWVFPQFVEGWGLDTRGPEQTTSRGKNHICESFCYVRKPEISISKLT